MSAGQSADLVAYRLDRAKESLEDARILADSDGGMLVSTVCTMHVSMQ